MPFIDSPYFAVVFIALLVGSVATGYLYARNRYFKKREDWRPSGVENSIIGFYGLLLSFTMLQSGTAYRERTVLIHQHAEALQRAYHQSFFLSDSLHEKVKKAFTDIVQLKIEVGHASPKKEAALMEEINQIYTRSWRYLKNNGRREGDLVQEGHLIAQQLHEAASIDHRIQFSYTERTPASIMILLVLGAWMVGLLIGFMNGFNKRHHFLVPMIFVLLAGLTILSIRDMDNPQRGLITPSYDHYEKALKEIQRE